MSNTKISALPAASALVGTEPLPIVQSGVTSKTLISAIATYFRGLVNAFSKNQSVAFVSLTSGASISVDASLSNNFYLALAHNATLANPTNLTDGMVLNVLVHNTGSFTLAYGSKWKFAGGVPTVTVSADDLISGLYNSTRDTINCGIGQSMS
jgi:hypothetical protein